MPPTLSPAKPYAIDLSHVSKVYGRNIHALRDISMQVHRGEIFGLLGPNGAGKSTLVKILMTVIGATRCEGTLLGEPVGRKSALARVGYLPEHHRFSDYLTGAQVLDYYGAMAKVPRAARRARAGPLLEMVGMTASAGRRVRTYSKGMRQRIGIAQALINGPELVLLDEPTDGVDPVGRRDIRNILLELKARGTTVFLNSHLLSELEMVCDRVAILVQGSVFTQGTLDELTVGQERYEIECGLATDGPGTLADAMAGTVRWDAAGRHTGKLANGDAVELAGDTLRIRTPQPEHIQPVIDALRGRSAVIRGIRRVRPSLEDLFMQAVTDPATGKTLPPGSAEPHSGDARRIHARPPTTNTGGDER